MAGALLLALAVLTLLAVRQDPRPEAFEDPVPLASASWWTYPVEWNAPERLPRIDARLQDVTVQPGTGRVWVVGEGGLILSSDDDGATWTQDTLAQQLLSAPAPAADAAEEDCIDYDPSAVSASMSFGGPMSIAAGDVELFRMPAAVRPQSRRAVLTLAEAHARVCFLGRHDDRSPVFTPEVVAYWKDAVDPGGASSPPCSSVPYDPATVRIARSEDAWRLLAWGARREHVLRTVASREVAERLLVLARRNTAACIPESIAPAQQSAEPPKSSGSAGADASQRPGLSRSLVPVRTASTTGAVAEEGRMEGETASAAEATVVDAWRWPSGVPDLRTVVFADRDRGWIAGPGAVLQTTDGGATWRHATEDVPAELAFVPRVEVSGDVDGRRLESGVARALTTTAPRSASEWSPARRASARQSETIPIADTRGGWMMATAIHETDAALWALFHEETGSFLARQAANPTGSLVGRLAFFSDSSRTVNDLHFFDDRAGWVVGDGGTVLRTETAGEEWLSVPVETTVDLHSISFPTGRTGWIAGAAGTLLRTSDGGSTWTPVLRAAGEVEAVQVSNAGWTLLTSTHRPPGAEVWASDDGTTWRSRGRLDTSAVIDLRVLDGGEAVALDDGGRVWRQASASDPWRLVRTVSLDGDDGRPSIVQPLPAIGAIGAAGRANLWLVARDDGQVFRSTNRGRTWRRLNVPVLGDVLPLRAAFADATAGYLAARSRDDSTVVVLRTTDAGASWEVANTVGGSLPRNASVHAAATSGPETLWLATAAGVFRSGDRGATWQPAAASTGSSVRALTFEDSRAGVLVTATGEARRTSDGGQSWTAHDLIPYHRWPAPWYYVALIGLAAVAAWRVRRSDWTDEDTVQTESVADLLMSDRPLRQGDPDALDLSSIARGLSRFMRNDRTEPPLTVAVTGAWGSGKSSLMNLLRANLRTFGFRPVWFNAWHHQKEEHLLAALLENVRQQALPPTLSRAGLRFRLRLFNRRIRGRLVAMAGWTSLLGAVALFATHSNALGPLWASLLDASNGGREIPGWTALLEGGLAALVGGGAALKVTALLGQALVAFGVTPAALMASLRRNARVRDLSAQTSFRYRFQQEFREVTEALQPRTMVIFIDDLDRCRPSNVLDLLEAVNFLVDSGNCFVVMGLDLARVQQYVEKGFREVDEEGFAEHYLEKLINIEVPVPHADEDDLYAVIRPDEDPEGTSDLADRAAVGPDDSGARDQDDRAVERGNRRSAYSRRVAQVQRGLQQAKWAATSLLVLLIGWIGGEMGASMIGPTGDRQPMTVSAPDDLSAPGDDPGIPATEANDGEASTGGSPDVDGADAGPAMLDDGRGAVVTGTRTVRLQPGEQPSSPTSPRGIGWLVVPIGLLGAGGAWLGWVVLQPKGVVVYDSAEFEQALEIWKAVLVRRISTPRAMKRFMNRVRYYAMHVRPPGPPETVAHRIAAYLTPPPERSDDVEPLNEQMLVAACALQVAGHLSLLLDAPAEGDGAPLPAAVPNDVRAAYEAHEATFGSIRSSTHAWRSELTTLFSRLESA